MKTYYTIKDGKVDRIRQAGKSPDSNWKEAPVDWGGSHGDKTDWFDKTVRRITDHELVRQGKRKDNRGKVYSINDRSSRQIYNLDENLTKDETKEAPLENEAYQNFDKKKNKWVVDVQAKEKAEKEAELGRLKAEIAEAEQKRVRSVLAIIDNAADKKDKEFNEFYKTQIEKLRPQITALETELKSA
jgi:hypothetical protein